MPLLPEDAATYNAQDVLDFANNIIDIILLAASAAVVIVFVWGAIQYFMAALSGDDSKVSQAKTMLYWAVIGIVVLLLSRIIVVQLFNIANVTPRDTIETPTTTQTP